MHFIIAALLFSLSLCGSENWVAILKNDKQGCDIYNIKIK